MIKYKKAVLVASAMVCTDRAPAGLAFLAGICDHHDLEYEVFDLNLFIQQIHEFDIWNKIEGSSYNMKFVYPDEQLEKIVNETAEKAVEKVLAHDPDIVAITSLSAMQIAWTEKFLATLKEKSDVTTIAGGPGISYEQEIGKTAGRILVDKGILDYFVLGEGDFAFSNFLKGQIDLGVNSKSTAIDQWVPQIDNLDELILPTYKKIDITQYGLTSSVSKSKIPSTINITGSRGCVRRCTFCDIGSIWKKFRFRSATHIVAEIIKNHNETGCLNYFFNDSLLNGSIKQFKEVMQEIIKAKNTTIGLRDLIYSGQFIVRPRNQHPEYLYELLRDSGCDHLIVGVESGSERVRNHMGKKFSNTDIDYHLEMSSKYGIKNFILMFTGYPTETLEDFEDTVTFYKKNQKYLIDSTIIGTSMSGPVILYTNTPLWEKFDELGIEIHDTQYSNISNWTVGSNPQLTVKERHRRFIELSKLATELRYPITTNNLVLVELYIEEYKANMKLKKINEKNKVIPIFNTKD